MDIKGLLSKVVMAFWAYDPCLACATHALPGEMDLGVEVLDHDGELVARVSR